MENVWDFEDFRHQIQDFMDKFSNGDISEEEYKKELKSRYDDSIKGTSVKYANYIDSKNAFAALWGKQAVGFTEPDDVIGGLHSMYEQWSDFSDFLLALYYVRFIEKVLGLEPANLDGGNDG